MSRRFSATTFDLEAIPYAVFDEDRSRLSRAFTAHLRASSNFREVAEVFSLKEAESLLEARQVWLVVHFPEAFSEKRRRGESAPLQLLLDGRNSNTAFATLGYLRAIAEAVFDRPRRSSSDPSLEEPRPQVTFEVRFWFNENLESRWFIIPGMVALMTLVATVTITALSIAREREEGTFDQLLMTPLTPLEIIIGKNLPPWTVGMVEGMGIVLLATSWFGVPFRGSLLLLSATLALYLSAVIGIGLMISALCRTQQQAFVGTFLFTVPTVILSSFVTPIENMPEPIQKLTLLNPMRYFLVIVRRLFLQGPDIALLWPQIWPLLLIALTTLVLSAYLVRRRFY